MTSPRYLTKSRFKLALECPTKLYYTGKKDYTDKKKNDSFLQALADGGFQVGELAKCYHPGGVEITTFDHAEAINETNKLLEQDKCIIYEAAFAWKNLFIRADILIKKGNVIDLIEVKAKSFESDDYDKLITKKGTANAKWKEYLYDITFQTYVLEQAFPNFTVNPYLMLANKEAVATVDGLNQKFFLQTNAQGRHSVCIVGDVTPEALGKRVLIKVDMRAIVDTLQAQLVEVADSLYGLEEFVEKMAENYQKDLKIGSPIGGRCAKCEFKATPDEEKEGLKSGFKECWKQQLRWSDKEFTKPLCLELWNSRKKDDFIKEGHYFLKDVTLEDIATKDSKENTVGLSLMDRQWLQIEKVRNNDPTPFIDKPGIKREIDSWKYPLHFIDFETTAIALPFHKGRRPYEGIAFQFSHHEVNKDGVITHKGQYLSTDIGKFPNFDFLRNLKKELEQDNGTIFRYALHENTYLNKIYEQLRDTEEHSQPDKQELMAFIRLVTHSKNDSTEKWQGARNMVDLLDVVKRYFYHPLMGGSNSIKAVLPAILNDSKFLQDKYSKPIYGQSCEIKSLNLNNHIWIDKDTDGKVINPYKTLPPVFDDITFEEAEELITQDSELADGGAAMTAYSRMQFTEISDTERKCIQQALLRYCELDTMAMVMLWEYFNNLV